MPLYEHYCQWCNEITEVFCRIDDRKQFVICNECGGSAERIISSAILRVEPTWLESAKQGIHSQDRDKIRDRNDLHNYMRNEGIDQVG
jgi:putative FmdB family regulatory protein